MIVGDRVMRRTPGTAWVPAGTRGVVKAIVMRHSCPIKIEWDNGFGCGVNGDAYEEDDPLLELVVARDNANQQLGQQMRDAWLKQIGQTNRDYGAQPAPDTVPEIPIAEPPEPEPTPIPERRVRRCYACGRDPHEWPATSRGPGEPAYCEEHRKK